MKLLMLLATYLISAAPAAGEDYCLRDSVNITCSAERVIVMTSAQYGRMRGGRCIKAEAGHIGCSTEVISQLDEVCSGRQHCTFPVANLLQHKPCPDDYTPYLETHHTCWKVSQSRCVNPDGFIFLTDEDGFIPLSSHSSKCPWRVGVDILQTLHFTLYSFGQRKVHSDIQLCPWFVGFEEGGKVMEHPLCHVASRETVLYTSRSNSVTVRVFYKQNVVLPIAYFLKYEAVGCPQLKVPGYAWVRQDDTKATVKCNQTEETWFLACNNREWHGEVGNCSKAYANDVIPTDSMSNVSKVTTLPFGFMIAVVIGVLLGIVIGAIPLALVYVCLKRKWRRQQPSCYIAEDPYYPGVQQTFVESNSGSVYPALLKRATIHAPGSTSPKREGDELRNGDQCCYGCAEPFVYNTVTANTGASSQWLDKQTTSDSKSCRQVECCRVLECPDVMAHIVTLHGGIQVPGGKQGPDHVYESAGFGKTRRAVAQEMESIPSDFVPIYYGSEAAHCYTAAKSDQSKVGNECITEIQQGY